MKLNVRRYLAFLLVLFSVTMTAWSLWPFPQETRSLILYPSDWQFLPGDLNAEVPQAIFKAHTLSLSWPQKIRTGQVQTIKAIFSPAPSEGGEKGMIEEGSPFLEISEEYSVMIEGRLELPGLEYSPEGQVSQLLQPNEPVTFVWNLKVENAAAYEGTMWLYLKFISKKNGQENKQVLTAQLLEFKGVDFLGLDYLSTRLIGSLGLAIGIILSFDRYFVDLWMMLQSKIKKSKAAL